MVETVDSLHDGRVCHLLGVATEKTRTAPDIYLQQEWVQEQLGLLKQYALFVLELACERTWAQAPFIMMLPHLMASVLHEDDQKAQEGLHRVRDIWAAVRLAESIALGQEAAAADVKRGVQQLLTDVGWHKTQLAREVEGLGAQGRWQSTDEQTRHFAWSIWGSPATTKFHLEDMFSHTSSVTKRIGKDLKLGKLPGLNYSRFLFYNCSAA